MASSTIAIVGGLNMDLIFKAKRMPNIGESIDASSLFILPGGKGANIAIAASRGSRNKPPPDETSASTRPEGGAQIRVCMNGAIGDDLFGQKLKDKLEQNDVDTSGLLTVQGQSSGVCAVLVEEAVADNKLIAYQGINLMWEPRDRESVECLGGGRRPDLVIAHLGIPQEKVVRVLKLATSNEIDTLLNPSPLEPVARGVYQYVTHLVANKPEAAFLSGVKLADFDTLSAWESIAQLFISWGVKNVIITLGDQGAYYYTSFGDKGIVEAEKDVDVVDVTGAGESFVGNYAVHLLRQEPEGRMDIGKAVRHACRAAARTIQSFGAQESSPWADEITGGHKRASEVGSY